MLDGVPTNTQDPEPDPAIRLSFPVVGIGASAGGIEALNGFFDAMPADSGIAFIVVLHLDPTHDSQLAAILGSHTTMPVVEIVDGMALEPNRVHVIVPDRTLRLVDGRLVLTEPEEPRGYRRPVDVLFASLARSLGSRAIGIILSGTGSNGTQGLREIRGQGGMALVQEPSTAKFDGMPRSAIASGTADHVLGPDALPDVLLRYIRHHYVATDDPDSKAAGNASELDPIIALLRNRAGQEFRHYKKKTLMRRVHRRMSLNNHQSYAAYAASLQNNPAEVEALVKDLLISVTGFFRDGEAWKALAEAVLAPLVSHKETGSEIRFWVPACSTGEEAYSLAMLFVELAEAAHKTFDLKIFATDPQEANLAVARGGFYLEAAAAPVGQQRLRRFFDRADSSYQVKKELRELIVFAPQNLLRDPPFSRLDLITCRNLLIYLGVEAQHSVLSLFHFGLRDGGHLFLGNAETVGRQDDQFETVSKTWRIYRRIGRTQRDMPDFSWRPASSRAGREPALVQPFTNSGVPPRVADMAQQALLEIFAPASVLIDRNGRVLYFHGSTGDFLEAPSGEPSRDVIAMARDGFRAGLRRAIRNATGAAKAVEFVAHVHHGGATRRVTVTVSPVPAAAQPAGVLLVSFQPVVEGTSPAPATTPIHDAGVESRTEQALEDELRAARIELQATIERMEVATEELKASNEEMMSMNEELQSTNEELETSKEEQQSFNEELHTINGQLQHKNQELEDTTNDLTNLLASTEIATIFLDRDFRIKWFSPAGRDLLDLVASDIGRPIAHFALKFTDGNLLRDAEAVLTRLRGIDAEVRSETGHWYLRRMLPYRTIDDRIAGLAVSYIDISARKAAADAVNEARIYAETIVDTVREPLLILDENMRVVSANRAFYTFFVQTEAAVKDRPVFELGAGEWNIPELRRVLTNLLPRDGVLNDFLIEHTFAASGKRTLLLNARQLRHPPAPDDSAGRAGLVLLAFEDITARRQAEAHRDLLMAEMGHRVKNSLATVHSIAWQTAQQSPTVDAFIATFEGRLGALGRAHDILIADGVTGSDIGKLVHQTLEPYPATKDGRVAVDGPMVVLPVRAAVALVMVFHELATNAAKYGALSTSQGQVQVTWRLDGDHTPPRVRLSWTESKGPPVSPPSRRGFGTSLIERSAEHELHGSAAMTYDTAGFRCELVFPVEAAAPNEPAAPLFDSAR